MTAASAHACPRRLPRIALLATGGTIAGAGPDSTAAAYVAGALRGQALLQAVPQLAQLAQVQVHELFALDSADISDAQRLQLAQRVAALARQGDVDGIVITHGTDTLEESAYLLHLTLKTAKPVVLTGAMRAATALGADGPLNLYQAVQVAASARAAGQGALVVMNGAIWSGRDVAKRDAAQVQALQSPYGPLGLVADDGPRFYRAPCRPHTLASEFDADALCAAARPGGFDVRPILTPPAAKEDIALVVDADVTAGELEDVVREAAGPLLEDLRLFDVYTGEQVAEGRKSLAFALRLRGEATLTAEETARVRKRVLKAARKAFGAELRA